MQSESSKGKKGDLEVTIIEARQIPVHNYQVYCTIGLRNNTPVETAPVKDVNPKWNKTFILFCALMNRDVLSKAVDVQSTDFAYIRKVPIQKDLMTLDDEELLIQMYAQRRLQKNKFMGQIQIPIKALNMTKEPVSYFLCQKPQNTTFLIRKANHIVTGELCVKLNFVHRLLRSKAPVAATTGMMTSVKEALNESGEIVTTTKQHMHAQEVLSGRSKTVTIKEPEEVEVTEESSPSLEESVKSVKSDDEDEDEEEDASESESTPGKDEESEAEEPTKTEDIIISEALKEKETLILKKIEEKKNAMRAMSMRISVYGMKNLDQMMKEQEELENVADQLKQVENMLESTRKMSNAPPPVATQQRPKNWSSTPTDKGVVKTGNANDLTRREFFTKNRRSKNKKAIWNQEEENPPLSPKRPELSARRVTESPVPASNEDSSTDEEGANPQSPSFIRGMSHLGKALQNLNKKKEKTITISSPTLQSTTSTQIPQYSQLPSVPRNAPRGTFGLGTPVKPLPKTPGTVDDTSSSMPRITPTKHGESDDEADARTRSPKPLGVSFAKQVHTVKPPTPSNNIGQKPGTPPSTLTHSRSVTFGLEVVQGASEEKTNEALMARVAELEETVKSMEEEIQRYKFELDLMRREEKLREREQQVFEMEKLLLMEKQKFELERGSGSSTRERSNTRRGTNAPRPDNGEGDDTLNNKTKELYNLERKIAERQDYLQNISDQRNGGGERMDMLVEKLQKLDKLDELLRKLDNMKVSGNSDESPQQSAAELKQEMENLKVIIFDTEKKYTEKEKEDANIKMEKAITAYSKTDEYQQELQKQIEERRRINEPLNKAALEKFKPIYTLENIKKDSVLQEKIIKNPELALIGMDSKAILSKHQNDFQLYLLRNLEVEELRAIRASLPKFRNDQKRQIDWVEGLENKIEESAKGGPPKPPKPKTAKSLNWNKPKKAVVSAGGGDMFSELLQKRARLGESGEIEAPPKKGEPEKKEVGSLKLAPRKNVSLQNKSTLGSSGSVVAPPAPPPPPL